MTREQEIQQKARDIAFNWNVGRGNEFFYRLDRLAAMALWADEHPKNPWRDARKDPPKRELGNKICYTFLDTAPDGVHKQRYYHYAEFKKCCFDRKEWLDEDGNLVLIGIADFWMPIPETPKGGEK